jgi:hypothetical protein
MHAYKGTEVKAEQERKKETVNCAWAAWAMASWCWEALQQVRSPSPSQSVRGGRVTPVCLHACFRTVSSSGPNSDWDKGGRCHKTAIKNRNLYRIAALAFAGAWPHASGCTVAHSLA